MVSIGPGDNGAAYHAEAKHNHPLACPFLLLDQFLVTLALLLSSLVDTGNMLHKDGAQLGSMMGID